MRPERAIARLLRDGRPVGLAFPVDACHVVTCAHVANAALGRPARETSAPPAAATIAVAFAFGGGDDAICQDGTVVGWLPELGGFDGHDVAVLRLSQEQPRGAGPLVLAGGDPTGEVQMWGPSGRRGNPGHVQGQLMGEVEDGRWQIDQHLRGVFRVQPGFSGGPVWRPATGEVVGVLQAAGTGEAATDAYVIGVDVIARALPAGAPTPTWPHGRPQLTSGRAAVDQAAVDRSVVTVLHLGDLQFGAHHRFGAGGLSEADRRHDALAARLLDDLAGLRRSHGLVPDVVVVAGDLAETAKPVEYDAAYAFLCALRDGLDLPTERIVVVPGNHDVNRKRCQAYFLECEDDDQPPVPPYWRKWEPFADIYARFYGAEFAENQPWSYVELSELRIAVAALNSTMADSHRGSDHYGWLGEDQMRYFTDRLSAAGAKGWLCLGVLHHNPVRGTGHDDAHLHDADQFTELLVPHLDVALHGHTHQARVEHLGPTALPVLGTGSAGVGAGSRPDEVPNQYQRLQLRPDGASVSARRYDPGRHRWVGDTAISADGNDWRRDISIRPATAMPTRAIRGGLEQSSARQRREQPNDEDSGGVPARRARGPTFRWPPGRHLSPRGGHDPRSGPATRDMERPAAASHIHRP